MTAVDRKWFVPPEAHAYQDSPQYIGSNATISAPHMHAHALSSLESKLRPGSRALDVGSGSGYLVACMSAMVGPTGLVVGVEHVDKLVKMSLANMEKAKSVIKSPYEIHVSDGRLVCYALFPLLIALKPKKNVII